MANFNTLEARFLATFGHYLVAKRPGCTTGQPQSLPLLDRDSFIEAWAPAMESDFDALKIPNDEWVYGGMFYLPEGLLKSVVTKTRNKIREKTGAEWTWDDYKTAVEETSIDFDALEAQFGETFGRRLRRNRISCTKGKPRDFPPLDRDSFINTWMPAMEGDFAAISIPDSEWVYAGMLYLPEGPLKTLVKKAKDGIRQETEAEWTWDDYTTAVVESIDTIGRLQRIGAIGSGVVLGLSLGPSLVVGMLSLIGLGSTGAAAGSIAAVVHSTGATGGLISALHSVAATGTVGAAGTAAAAVGAVGGTVAAVAAVANFFFRRR